MLGVLRYTKMRFNADLTGFFVQTMEIIGPPLNKEGIQWSNEVWL